MKIQAYHPEVRTKHIIIEPPAPSDYVSAMDSLSSLIQRDQVVIANSLWDHLIKMDYRVLRAVARRFSEWTLDEGLYVRTKKWPGMLRMDGDRPVVRRAP